MSVMYNFYFPDGKENQYIDLSYCSGELRIGEKIIFEGEEQIYLIDDIQNQFKRLEDEGAGECLKQIMKTIILSEFTYELD